MTGTINVNWQMKARNLVQSFFDASLSDTCLPPLLSRLRGCSASNSFYVTTILLTTELVMARI